MKRFIILCLSTLGLLTAGCVKEPELDASPVGEGEVWATLDFGHTDFEKIQVTTRSTLGLIAESRVTNLYVFLFDRNGNRVYGHFFDYDNKRSTRPEVVAANVNCWMVDNLMNGGEQTRGTIRMKIPQLSGGTFYLVANSTPICSTSRPRNSASSYARRTRGAGGRAQSGDHLPQRHVPHVGPGRKHHHHQKRNHLPDGRQGRNPADRNGFEDRSPHPARRRQRNPRRQRGYGDHSANQGFHPESWQVVNLPKGTFLVEHPVTDAGGYDAETGFFDSPEVNFETQTEESFKYTNSDGTQTTVTAPSTGSRSMPTKPARSQKKRSGIPSARQTDQG